MSQFKHEQISSGCNKPDGLSSWIRSMAMKSWNYEKDHSKRFFLHVNLLYHLWKIIKWMKEDEEEKNRNCDTTFHDVQIIWSDIFIKSWCVHISCDRWRFMMFYNEFPQSTLRVSLCAISHMIMDIKCFRHIILIQFVRFWPLSPLALSLSLTQSLSLFCPHFLVSFHLLHGKLCSDISFIFVML